MYWGIHGHSKAVLGNSEFAMKGFLNSKRGRRAVKTRGVYQNAVLFYKQGISTSCSPDSSPNRNATHYGRLRRCQTWFSIEEEFYHELSDFVNFNWGCILVDFSY